MRLVAAWRGALAMGDGVPAVGLVPVMTTRNSLPRSKPPKPEGKECSGVVVIGRHLAGVVVEEVVVADVVALAGLFQHRQQLSGGRHGGGLLLVLRRWTRSAC